MVLLKAAETQVACALDGCTRCQHQQHKVLETVSLSRLLAVCELPLWDAGSRHVCVCGGGGTVCLRLHLILGHRLVLGCIGAWRCKRCGGAHGCAAAGYHAALSKYGRVEVVFHMPVRWWQQQALMLVLAVDAMVAMVADAACSVA